MLEALLETSADAALVVDEKRVILAANTRAEHDFGYSRSELIGQSPDMLVAEMARETHERASDEYLGSPTPRVVGHPGVAPAGARRKDGTTFEAEVTLSPLRTETGMLVVAMIRDVSERARAEAALRAQDERFRTSVETMPEAFGVYSAIRDRDGRIVDFRVEYVNQMAGRLKGLMREEHSGRGLRASLESHGQAALFDAYRRVVETGEPFAWDFVNHTDSRSEGDGRNWAFAIRAARLGDGLVATWRDITGRLEREEERKRLLAQESAARVEAERAQCYLSLLAQAGNLLDESLDYETTLRCIVDLMVPAVANFCALDVAARDGSLRRLTAVSPGLDEQVTAALRAVAECAPTPGSRHPVLEALRTARSVIVGDVAQEHLAALVDDPTGLQLLRRAGVASAAVIPMRAHGRVVGTLLLVWLRRRKPEDHEIALAEELAGRAAVHLENARLYTDLEEAIRTRDAFFALASHDLKSPLSTLNLGIEVLRELLDEREPSSHAERRERRQRQRRSLNQMQSIALRMLGLVNEFIDLAHLEEGRELRLQRRDLDLVALTRDYVSVQSRSSHTMCLEALDSALVGCWDEARMTRVLDNLVSNAMKYSPSGTTVTITLRREAGDDGEWAVLSVADQGVGIPPGELEWIFERFHRGSNVQDQSGGAGLGLWGARHVVEQHGGTISVESSEGVGSVFTVRLPLTVADT